MPGTDEGLVAIIAQGVFTGGCMPVAWPFFSDI